MKYVIKNQKETDFGFLKKLSINELLNDIQKDHTYFFMSCGQFSLDDLIRHVAGKIGVCEGLIVSWVASSSSLKKMLQLLDTGLFDSVRLILDRTVPATRPHIFKMLVESIGAEFIRIINIHSKLAILRNNDYSVVIETSANLNRNFRVENFRISENSGLADFLNGFFDEVFQTISAPSESPKMAQRFNSTKLRKIGDINLRKIRYNRTEKIINYNEGKIIE